MVSWKSPSTSFFYQLQQLSVFIILVACMGATSSPNMISKTIKKVHIIGGGPTGISIGLLLAKEGVSSVIYEGRREISNNVEESYPIGVNQRGLHTLNLISKQTADACLDTGKSIDSWNICAGKRTVAEQKSGVVVGTSRV